VTPAPADPNAALPAVTPAPEGTLPTPTEAPVEPVADETAVTGSEAGGMEGAPQIKQGIRGRVTDSATGEGIIEGQVQVIDRNKKTLTDLDGNFAISLPPGSYSLRVFYELYEPQRVDNIEVKRGQATTIDVKLAMPSNVAQAVQEEVVIVARADKANEATQLAVRKESAAVRDNISAQEISRSGASNAADAIRRVVSATVDPNNKLIVRGLGSRYTRVLIRGFRIPSTDPDDPGVELDLFPAGVLSNLSVVKTFTPDLPGDFAGGIMQIETREFPTEFLLQSNVAIAYNTEATFQDVPDYEGGKLDFLGFDDGDRALPSSIPNKYITSKRKIGEPDPAFTNEEVEAFGEAFKNNYNVTQESGLPNMSLGLVAGDTLKIGGKDLGYLAAFGYSHRTVHYYARIREAQGTLDENGDFGYEAGSDFLDDRGRRQAQWGALTTFSLELTPRSDLTLTTLLSQSGQRDTNFAEGTSLDRLLFAQRRLRWVERQLFFSQLRGEHREIPQLHKLTIDWNATIARAGRKEPDTRTIRYTKPTDNDPYVWTFNQRSPGRFFSELGEWTLGTQADLSLPVIEKVKLKAGGQSRHSWADFNSRRFLFEDTGVSDDLRRLGPEQIFTAENIGNGLLFKEGTINTDGYEASSALYSAYAMGEVSPVAAVRLIAGVRYEDFQQDLEAVVPTANQPVDPTKNVDESSRDLLPAGAAVVEVAKDMYVRASYGMTIARPLFRELAPFVYEDDVRRISVSGNPDLERSRIHNVDLRWEMFPAANEVLALTGFYKRFIDPIEPYQIGTLRSFQNAEGATNLGGELEARFSLGRFNKALKLLQAGANLTYVWSRIEIAKPMGMEPGNTSSKRPLAGQSPYVANLSLGVSDPSSKMSVFLYYNVFGKRIDQVGANNLPDQYELPFHSLDLIGSYTLDDHWTLRLSARNLAFRETRIKEGPIMRERFNPGTLFQVGASFNY